MVKLYGPCMSLQASGTLADTLTFSTWKGRPYARERVIPSNPQSGDQVGRRAMFKFLTQAWNALTAGEKASWQTIADQLVASTFNAYLSENMTAWHNYIPPTQDTPALETDNGSDNALTAAVWEQNRIKLSYAGTGLAEAWGIVTFGTSGAAITPAVGNVIMVDLDTTIAAHSRYWTPPTVGQYTFDSRAFSHDRIFEALGGPQTAAAP